MTFDRPGKQNTSAVLETALKTARSRKIPCIVLPATMGESALALSRMDCSGLHVVCVTHVTGFRTPGEPSTPPEACRALREAGFSVVTATHLLSGAERCLSGRFGGVYPVEIMAHTLRMLGQGVKVALEVACMAVDAGEAPWMTPILSLGGTGRGLDTAVVLRASHGASILDSCLDEILCKPQLG